MRVPRRFHLVPRTTVLTLLLIVAHGDRALFGQLPGPGVPPVTYPPEQVFTPIARIRQAERPNKHGAVILHNGYLVVPVFEGLRDGRYLFYELSDPSAPRLVGSAEHPDIRESHAIGLSYSYPGLYAVTQGSFGIHFWDWTDVENPVHLEELTLPDIEASDYDNGVWWVFWQAPYVYVSGASRGLYIVDATDPQKPKLLRHLQTSDVGGFRLGSVFAVGNLLVLTANDQEGLAMLDISDPVAPVLLSTDRSRDQYSSMVNGDHLLLASNSSGDRALVVLDISDPSDVRFVQKSPLSGQVAYLTFQDGFAHVGNSVPGYFKIDIRDAGNYPRVGSVDFPEPGVDLDYAVVAGNLVFLGDDNGHGTMIVPHQSAPDTTPPAVNRVVPKSDAVDQALTTRVGVTLTDQIELRSVDRSSFIVRPVGGDPLVGKYSGQTGIVNFSPDEPLDPNTTYEIVVPAGGIRDYAGNAVSTEFTSFFSTGSEISFLECTVATTQPVLVDETVTFAVESCVSDVAVAYSWDFGDGTEPTPVAKDPETTHAYTVPGHYPVIFRATDGTAESRVTFLQTVTLPATPRRPTRATPIVLDASRGHVWNVNPDNDTVTAIDAQSYAKLSEWPVGSRPTTLALAADDTIWVVNQDSATISVLRTVDGVLEETVDLPYGSRPHGVAFSPTGAAGYVTLEGTGELAVVDPVERKVLDRITVGARPRGLAITHDGQRIFVARFVSPQNHGEVVEVSAESFDVTRVFELAPDPGPDTESSGRGVPNYLLSLTISPDGRRLWVASKKDNTGRGGFVSGESLTFDSAVRTIVSQIDLLSNEEDLKARRDLNDRALASAVAFTSRGDFAFVATLGSNTVDVLDAYSGHTVTSIDSGDDLGLAPRGLVLSGDDRHLFVHNFLSREVSIFDVTDVGRGNVFPRLSTVGTVATEKLPPEVLRGKQIFYNSADDRMADDNYISCAVCHLDGGSDHRVWDFTDRGEGLRNTPTLRGRGGLRHGPVHWSANFDEIQDFEHDIRGAFQGRGFLTDEQFRSGTRDTTLGDPKASLSAELDALASYVSSLTRVPASPFRNADGSMTADAIAGAEVFYSQEAGCSDCHTGRELTDSRLVEPFQLHDVGTIQPGSGQRLGGKLEGIDTPTLIGAWATAPYLHDGSAATLDDVLTTANPDDRHGRTSHLTATEREQLVAYLLQLENPGANCPPDGGTDGCVNPPAMFQRGDVNDDGGYDISDVVKTLNFLFLGRGEIFCSDAADANDDGGNDVSDPVYTLSYLFSGGEAPPAPFGACGDDPSGDGLGCESFAFCE